MSQSMFLRKAFCVAKCHRCIVVQWSSLYRLYRAICSIVFMVVFLSGGSPIEPQMNIDNDMIRKGWEKPNEKKFVLRSSGMYGSGYIVAFYALTSISLWSVKGREQNRKMNGTRQLFCSAHRMRRESGKIEKYDNVICATDTSFIICFRLLLFSIAYCF